MKNKKGFTLIEVLICIAIVGIIAAIAIPNIKVALDKNKKKNSRHTEYTMPSPQVNQTTEAETPNIIVTELGSKGMFTFYRLKDRGREYLIVWNHVGGGIAITSRW